MKLLFLVDHDLASLVALNHLIPLLNEFEHSVFHSRKGLPTSKQNQGLNELGSFSQGALHHAKLTSFAEFGSRQMNDINGADFELFRAEEASLIISIRHMTILRPPVINSVAHGVINLHSGRLPDYQGVMATFWAMRDACDEIGTSLHRIEDAQIDTGQIIERSSIKVNYQKSYLWNVLSLYAGGCQTISRAVRTLAADKPLNGHAQQGHANYHSYPSQAELDAAKFELFNEEDLKHPALKQ